MLQGAQVVFCCFQVQQERIGFAVGVGCGHRGAGLGDGAFGAGQPGAEDLYLGPLQCQLGGAVGHGFLRCRHDSIVVSRSASATLFVLARENVLPVVEMDEVGVARKTQIVLEDDLTGDLLEDGTGETVLFAFDGTSFEIDLSTDNATEMREALSRYTGAARTVSSASPRASASPSSRKAAGTGRSDLAEIREWAKSHGHEVSERGRIKNTVMEAYDAAH